LSCTINSVGADIYAMDYHQYQINHISFLFHKSSIETQLELQHCRGFNRRLVTSNQLNSNQLITKE